MTIKNVLISLCPKVKPGITTQLALYLNQYLPKYEVNTPQRVAAFLSQAAYETGCFKWFTELGDEKYFNKYENRSDLGNTQPGDGVLYKGRGIFQLTGRANYKKFGEILNFPLLNQPEAAAELEIAVRIACEFWKERKLNQLADIEDIKTITRKINGGLNGYSKRLQLYQKIIDHEFEIF